MQDKTFLFIGFSALIHVSVIGGFIAQTKLSEFTEQGSSALDVELVAVKKNLHATENRSNEHSSSVTKNQQAVIHSAKQTEYKSPEKLELQPAKPAQLARLDELEQKSENQKFQNVVKKNNPDQVDDARSLANTELLAAIIRSELSRHFYYPKVAQRRNWQGQVMLGYTVTASGVIEKIRISKSSGFQVLDDAAVTALKKVDAREEMAVATSGLNVDQLLPVQYSLVE